MEDDGRMDRSDGGGWRMADQTTQEFSNARTNDKRDGVL